MANGRMGVVLRDGRTLALSRVGRLTLLVPEGPLLLVLVGGFLALGQPPLLAATAAVVALSFGVRAAALYSARWLLAAGHHRDADVLARIALAMHPWSADALALRAALALLGGDAPLAERMLRRSLELLPGSPARHAALSGALLEGEQLADAAEEARRALALDTGCAAAYLHLAEAELRLGLPAAVVEERLRAGLAAANDLETETTLRCALAWHLVGQERCAEARLATSGVEATLPRCRPAHQARLRIHLCELLVAQGQTERARELICGTVA